MGEGAGKDFFGGFDFFTCIFVICKFADESQNSGNV